MVQRDFSIWERPVDPLWDFIDCYFTPISLQVDVKSTHEVKYILSSRLETKTWVKRLWWLKGQLKPDQNTQVQKLFHHFRVAKWSFTGIIVIILPDSYPQNTNPEPKSWQCFHNVSQPANCSTCQVATVSTKSRWKYQIKAGHATWQVSPLPHSMVAEILFLAWNYLINLNCSYTGPKIDFTSWKFEIWVCPNKWPHDTSVGNWDYTDWVFPSCIVTQTEATVFNCPHLPEIIFLVKITIL